MSTKSKAASNGTTSLPGHLIAPNLHMEQDGDRLSFHMSLSAQRSLSSTKLTESIAVVRGFGQVVGVTPDGQPITLQFNARVPNPAATDADRAAAKAKRAA